MRLYYKKMVRVLPRLSVGLRYRTISHFSSQRLFSLHCEIDLRWGVIEIGFAIWAFSAEIVFDFHDYPEDWDKERE